MSDVEAGLSGLQKLQGAASLSNALPKPKTSHPYVVGLIFTGIGLFSLVGSITGTLPSMLAALFVPQALEDASGKNAAGPDHAGGPLGPLTGPITNPIEFGGL